MAKTNASASSDADSTIDALLQQRAQYEQWLARLDSTAEKASAAVRERVRADYEARLRQVIDELRGYAATIAEELGRHHAAQSQLDAERRKAEEALAEAEVRHVVGEYSDDEWQRLSEKSQRHLEGLRGELHAIGAEIARLAEVQTLIETPSPTSKPVTPAAPAFSAMSPVPTPVAATAAPARVAATPGAGPALDELAFLKSVSDEEPAPVSRRSSNPAPVVAPKPIEPMPAPPPVAQVAAPSPVPAAAPVSTPAPAAVPAAGGGGKTAGMAKTLKCNECGTFNRPTEWYCERCGAELAAL